MKIKFLSPLIAGIAMTCFALTAQADPITGGVTFTGQVTLPVGTNIGNATAFLSFNNPPLATVTIRTGSYIVAGVGTNDPVAVNAFTFGGFAYPYTLVPPLQPLWHSAGGLAEGDIMTIVSLFQTFNETSQIGSATINGTGMLHLVGFDPTMGSYVLDVTQGGSTLGFTYSAFVPVPGTPDGGTTLLLLGMGLLGVGAVARRFKSAKA
jgi:hypothetical protein